MIIDKVLTGAAARVAAIAAGAALLLGLSSIAALAQNNIVLENHTFDGGEAIRVSFPRIEFTNTNFDRGDVKKLFTASTSKEELAALGARLKAARIAIPAATLRGKDLEGTVSGIVAFDISGGIIRRYMVKSYRGSSRGDDGKEELKVGFSEAENGDVVALIQMMRDNDALSDISQYTRFSIRDLEMGFEDTDEPARARGGNMNRIKIGRIAVDARYDGNIIRHGTMHIEKLAFAPHRANVVSLRELGLDRPLVATMTVSGSYDQATRTLQSHLTLHADRYAALSIESRLNDVDASVVAIPPYRLAPAIQAITVSDAEIRFANVGLVDKLLAQWANDEKKPLAKLRREWVSMAEILVPGALGFSAETLKFGKEAGRFIDKPKEFALSGRPKGEPIKLSDLMAADDLKALLQKLDMKLSVNDGVRPKPPGQASIVPMPVQQASARETQPTPVSSQRLEGRIAWEHLIDNSIVGKHSDGRALTQLYLRDGTVKQLIDDEVATGAWAVRGDKVCFKFPAVDEVCHTLLVESPLATLTDDKGIARSYDIISGNPKRL